MRVMDRGDEQAVREFFDRHYALHGRYWWRGENRYSLDPARHTAFNAAVLAHAQARRPGRALDLGAGEGADAIRLAKLGWQVEAVELSPVACEKIESFARAERVAVHVRNESMATAALTDGAFDLVLMNGSLHYIADKHAVLTRVKHASAAGAAHIVSLFSTASPTPLEHTAVPVFPDDEGGVVEDFYQGCATTLLTYERDKPEHSHPGFDPHRHSYIKLITSPDQAEQR